MTDQDTDQQRIAAVEKLNKCVVDLNDAQKRHNDAKAQLGTAEQQLRQARADYRNARRRLDKLLPDVGGDGGDDGDGTEEQWDAYTRM